MSQMVIAGPDGNLGLSDPIVKPIRDRLRQAREHKRQFESNWALNLAFAGGDHWATWDNAQRTLRRLQDVDPRYRGRELITADAITEYRTTALGELGGENDRPQILLARNDEGAEAFEAQLNRGLGFGWEHEFMADDVLGEVDRFIVDLGTCAVRCRWDPQQGPVIQPNVPHQNGKPLLDIGEATAAAAAAVQNGETLEFKDMRGKICWEPVAPMGMLVPPGITHEDRFPWEGFVRPVYVPDVLDQYGDAAVGLQEDGDIRSDLGQTVTGSSLDITQWGTTTSRTTQRLRDHVWVFTYYERPSRHFPQGRVATFASNQMRLIDYQTSLPYLGPDGNWRSGIAYFHWWRVTGRFWSRSLMDVMRDPQRGLNKRRTQINEIIDRSMPYVFVQKDSKALQRVGYPMEMVELGAQERPPIPSSGIAPGPWMQAEVEAIREDLEHATGLRGPRLGENPSGVSTYSQLALLSETEQTKRNTIRLDRQRAIRRLVEDTVHDMRTYWGPQKQIMLAGDEDRSDVELFNATKIPTFFLVKIAEGTAKPRGQAAQLQLITDVWNASVTSAQPLPVKWYKDSLEAGEPLDLPSEDQEDPADKAEMENHLMINNGTPMPIAYYDIHSVHLPIHRRAQDDAMFSQDMQLWQLIEQHCQLHLNAAVAQQQAAMQQQAVQGAAQQALPSGRNPGPSGQGMPTNPAAGPPVPKPGGP